MSTEYVTKEESATPRAGHRDPLTHESSSWAPRQPQNLDDCGIDPEMIGDLALKLAHTVPKFSTHWAASSVCLPIPIVGVALEKLRVNRLIEVLGQRGPFNHDFSITNRGIDRAERLLRISGYVGPAPVSLPDYTEALELQMQAMPPIKPELIKAALTDLVLPKHVVDVAGLAALSGRSLFLYGPPGNGKTTVGHQIHDAVECDLWIPHCIQIESNIIRVFDPEVHEPLAAKSPALIDRRWVRVKRPFIVAGGELSIESLDLIYSEQLGFYEAPLHFKANGGTFLLDDFGCQRVPHDQLLNRWVYPLERNIDYLTFKTGQKIAVPFRQMLVISTNLDIEKVMTPAFLRRIGYRVYLGDPTPEEYSEIFRRFAEREDIEIESGIIDHALKRYHGEGRPMHSCEPRDLISRSRDICQFYDQPLHIDKKIFDLAWEGYFGNKRSDADEPGRV